MIIELLVNRTYKPRFFRFMIYAANGWSFFPSYRTPLLSSSTFRLVKPRKSKSPKSMALILPCTFCTSLQRQNFPINRRRYSPNFRRGATRCEFRIPVEVSTPSDRGSLAVPSHKVTVHDRQRGVVHEFEVPEDQYILHSAESQNITLPFACRHGCCTSCAVRVKSGELRQPQALGIAAELKSQERDDYALELAMGDE